MKTRRWCSLCLGAVLAALVFGRATALAEGSPLQFFYVNWSPFHGDGEVAWLGADGRAVVQRATREKVVLYRFQLGEAAARQVRADLAALHADRAKVVDRLGIPDEVRARLGFRQGSGPLRRFEVLERDFAKQGAEIRALREVARVVLTAAATQKPTREQPNGPGAMTLERPGEFAAVDVDTALK